MERLVAYTGYLIGFATGGIEVTFFYWVFVPLMIDHRRATTPSACSIDPVPPDRERRMTELDVADDAFKWFITLLTGGRRRRVVRLRRVNSIRAAQRAIARDPIVRDKRFGYVIGIVIGVVGVHRLPTVSRRRCSEPSALAVREDAGRPPTPRSAATFASRRRGIDGRPSRRLHACPSAPARARFAPSRS